MGWSFGYDDTKTDVIRNLTRDQEWGEKDGIKRHSKALAHCVRGTILWYVREITGEGIPSERFIGCSILGKGGKDMGWGSKDMEESSGPVYHSCPLSYLDMVPDPGSYATAWREQVRKYWNDRKVGIKIGETPIVLKIKGSWKGGGMPITTIKVHRSGNRIVGYFDGYLMKSVPQRMLIGAEVVTG